jgi:hypothetical protein
VPADGSKVNLEICADSFTEFLYRFWIENEIWYRLHDSRALAQEAAPYAAQLTVLPTAQSTNLMALNLPASRGRHETHADHGDQDPDGCEFLVRILQSP